MTRSRKSPKQRKCRPAAAEMLEYRRMLADVTLVPGSAALVTLESGVAAEYAAWVFQNRSGTSSGLPNSGTAGAVPGLGLSSASTAALGNTFDRGHSVWVNNSVFLPTGGVVHVDDAIEETPELDHPTVLNAGPVAMSGLDVSVQYRAAQSSATLRTLITLTNGGAGPVSAPVSFVYNLGSDASTVVHGTSSGDTPLLKSFLPPDAWIVTDDTADPNLAGTRPAVTSVLSGPGSPAVVPSGHSTTVYNFGPAGTPGSTVGMLANFDVTVPAGQTRALMLFTQLNSTAKVALEEVAKLWQTPQGDGSAYWDDLIGDLTDSQLDGLLNWQFNTPPVANDDALSLGEDTVLAVQPADLLGNDTDAEGNALSVVETSLPLGRLAHGTLAMTNGVLTYEPDPNFYGTDSFTYRVTDGEAQSDAPATVTLHVLPVNDRPTVGANAAAVAGAEGASLINTGTFSDVESDAAPVTLSASLGQITSDAGAGTWSWSYAAADDVPAGTVVTVTATDAGGETATVGFTLSVANAAPTIQAVTGPASGLAGQALHFSGAFADAGSLDTHTAIFDWGDGTTSAAVVTAGAPGSGVASAVHAYRSTGNYTVTLTVTDDDGGSRSFTRSVAVQAADVQPDPAYPGTTALFVGGTDGGDLILVGKSSSPGLIDVWVNGASVGSFAPTGRIVVYAGGGNDMVLVQAPANEAWLYGEGGNDMLLLVSGGRSPPGGILFGGDGSDLMIGSRGRDILVGGAGADLLVGPRSGDMLISGETPYDDRFAPGHDAAWAAMRDGWVSPYEYTPPTPAAAAPEASPPPEATPAPDAAPAPEVPPSAEAPAATGDGSATDGSAGTTDVADSTAAAAPPETTTVVEADSSVAVEPEPTNPEIVLLDTEVLVEAEVLVEPGVLIDTAVEIAADGAAEAEVAVVEESAPADAEVVFGDTGVEPYTSPFSDDLLTSPLVLESATDVLIN